MAGRKGYVVKNIRNAHPEIRERVVTEALSRGVTLSDVVGEVIAVAWDMQYEHSSSLPAGSEPQHHATQMNVRIPQEMATRIWLVSRSRGITEASVVQELLADHYGIEYAPVKRGGVTRRRVPS